MLQLTTPYVERFDAPEKFYGWWDEITTCSALEVPSQALDSIQFWSVNDSSFIVEGITGYTAYAYVYDNEIFVTKERKDDAWTIKHEMLHFILYWKKEGYTGGHPWQFKWCRLLGY